MNPPSHENPSLTAYVLDELDAHQSAQMHGLLRISPSANSEMEQIEAVAEALRREAPAPTERLHPAQRQAVLNPVQMPRMMTPMLPRPMPARNRTSWPVFAGILKAAAVVALSSAGYWAGSHSVWTSPPPAILTSETIPLSDIEDLGNKSVEKMRRERPAVVSTLPDSVKAKSDQHSVPKSESSLAEAAGLATEEDNLPPATVPTDQPKAAADPVLTASSGILITPPAGSSIPRTLTRPSGNAVFVSTSRQAISQTILRPVEIRPLPPRTAQGRMFASPLKTRPGSSENGTEKMRAPELYIHSWKAEVASSPWNSGHRLMRVTLQLPADQPAATQPFSYPLQVAFDPNNVREYRQICERHQPAEELRRAGTHSVWFEFLPNGKTDSGKTVATITLPQARFTTQTVGPFDGSKLSVQDRGLDWQSAREDFIFDSAVIGFSLLLRSASPSPQLNHQLVLTLAEKTLNSDTSGERRRFVHHVREASKAAGL